MTESGRLRLRWKWPLQIWKRMAELPKWEEKKRRSVDLLVTTDAALDRFCALPGVAAGSPSGRISRDAAINAILGPVLKLSADEAEMMQDAAMKVLVKIARETPVESCDKDVRPEWDNSFLRLGELVALFAVLSDDAVESRRIQYSRAQ